jgi:hypothetical protein
MTEQKTCVRIDCHVLADILGVSSSLVLDRDDDLVEADLLIYNGYQSAEIRKLNYELSAAKARDDSLAKDKAHLQASIQALEADLASEREITKALHAKLQAKEKRASTLKPAAKPAAKPRVKK